MFHSVHPPITPKQRGVDNPSQRGSSLNSLNKNWGKKKKLLNFFKNSINHQTPSAASPEILTYQLKLHRVMVRWQVTGDIWQVTRDTWHLNHDFFGNFVWFLKWIFWYWCEYPHIERFSVSRMRDLDWRDQQYRGINVSARGPFQHWAKS